MLYIWLMRKLILIAFAGLSMASCTKCYKCTTIVSYSGAGAHTPSGGSSNGEFCGSKKDKDEYERNGTNTSTASSGGVTLVSRTVTRCQ